MLINTLQALRDQAYASFTQSLIPTISPQTVIGVRVPELRRLAKQLIKEGKADELLSQLPHAYFEENMLCALIINEIKSVDALVQALDRFLPHVDNWAVCDTLSPKAFKKHPDAAFDYSLQNLTSNHPYTSRFSVKILMSLYLGECFRKNILSLPLKALEKHPEHYYIQMMVAWFYASALSSQWEDTLAFLKERPLPKIVGKMTLQKARDSFRLSKEQKTCLEQLLK